ncbi:hypothetical protein HPE56_03400 [Maribacter sp. ANRC-HE7]|uniref:WG containing repeat-containing protein n=1 Tax=Maribacter aquimaris TaxID=2737171 RepID=A0ABR7UXT3_9FLAO|nr:DUF6515 family protein [Maribacter aquimaris]MBD0776830.1 hypothetical protein [Maribacter aquimaris]
MKKSIFLLVVPLLLTGSHMYGQQNKDVVSSSNKKSLSTATAMVNGEPTDVVFGEIPVLEPHYAMYGNIILTYNDQKYYFNKGDFFIYNGGRYLLIAPPIGIKVKNFPKDESPMEQVGENIFYNKGIFYKKAGSGFEVIQHPIGAIIYNLPHFTDVAKIDGEAYYEYLGVLYKKTFVQGEQAFKVVGQLIE